jgi:hypothetical protein
MARRTIWPKQAARDQAPNCHRAEATKIFRGIFELETAGHGRPMSCDCVILVHAHVGVSNLHMGLLRGSVTFGVKSEPSIRLHNFYPPLYPPD